MNFDVEVDIINEIQECCMFDNGLRDEIRTSVFFNLFSKYNHSLL